MNKYRFLIGILLAMGLIFSIIDAGYCAGAGTFYGDASGRLVGHLSVYAVTNESTNFQPIYIHDGDTYAGHTTSRDTIPLEAKYKTIIFKQKWYGAPKDVGGQIDVYTGGDIYFQAPLEWYVGSGSASSVSIRYKDVTYSGGAGAWIRWTPLSHSF